MRFRTTHKKLASGRKRIYYYTPAGTRFFDNMDVQLAPPFPDAFVQAYDKALASDAPGPSGDMADLIAIYMASPEYAKLRPATQKGYKPILANIVKRLGTASIAVIEDRRFRGTLMNWRDEMKEKPRWADLHMIVLSLALRHGLHQGRIDRNPAEDIPRLYKAPMDKTPWSEQEIAAYLQKCPQHLADAFWLKLYTGLRRTDLVRITWAADQGEYLLWTTSKRGVEAVIPLVPEARAFLDGLKRRQMDSKGGLQPTLLLNSRGHAWTPDGYSTSFGKHQARSKVTINEHRLRANTATFWAVHGLDDREIADVLGWSLGSVKQLRRVYVDRKQAVVATLERVRRERG